MKKFTSLMDIIEARTSIRSYKSQEVEEEKLNYILDAFRLAPSAKNLQPWKLVVVKNKKIIKDLAIACNNQTFLEDADGNLWPILNREIAYERATKFSQTKQIFKEGAYGGFLGATAGAVIGAAVGIVTGENVGEAAGKGAAAGAAVGARGDAAVGPPGARRPDPGGQEAARRYRCGRHLDGRTG